MRNRIAVCGSFAGRVTFLCLISLVSCLSSYSQTSTSSPYSRFGLGDLQYSGFANLNAMGGNSYAYQNDTNYIFYINAANPASHSNYRLTAFDIGVQDQYTMLQTSSAKFNTNRAALSNIAIAFPIIQNKWGASFGVMPYSNVGYSVNTSSPNDSTGTIYYSYQGTGGLNEIYFASGYRIKNFSAGLNISYLFGELQQESRDSFPDMVNSFSTRLIETKNLHDILLKGGLQYKCKLSSSWSALFGATGSLQTNVNMSSTTLSETYRYRFNIDQVRDTIEYTPDVKGSVKLPAMFGFGVGFRKNDKWLLTADFSTQNWSSFDSFGQKGLLGNSNRISAGMQYWPDRNGQTAGHSYFRRVAYRAGVRYSNSYLVLNNNAPLTDMGVSIGFGLPVRPLRQGENVSFGIVNLSFEAGQRGTIENNLIRENYVRAMISFTINEKWFLKRAYE